MITSAYSQTGKIISVLVADDSLVFRRYLRDIFENTYNVRIVGEARNGIEALDLILKVDPDVVLMDMEMPLMDGMTALQHLMIHRPLPTIMFSSLSNEGTARAFDALKSGAVDFVCKDFIFQEKNLELYKKLVIDKVVNAASVKVQSIDPIFLASQESPSTYTVDKQVIFCEECGARQVMETEKGQIDLRIRCSNCGDILEVNSIMKYRRNTFITVIGGGEGAFRNLLNIIPRLDVEMGGAVIAVVHAEAFHVDSFTEYLDSISSFNVMRIREGMNIEGGNCYVASAMDNICLRPYSAQYTLQRVKKNNHGIGSIDLAMASVASIFKNKSAGVLVSGEKLDGIRGIATVLKNKGTTLLLNPDVCLSQRLPKTANEKCKTEVVANESALVEKIQALHYQAKTAVSTA